MVIGVYCICIIGFRIVDKAVLVSDDIILIREIIRNYKDVIFTLLA